VTVWRSSITSSSSSLTCCRTAWSSEAASSPLTSSVDISTTVCVPIDRSLMWRRLCGLIAPPSLDGIAALGLFKGRTVCEGDSVAAAPAAMTVCVARKASTTCSCPLSASCVSSSTCERVPRYSTAVELGASHLGTAEREGACRLTSVSCRASMF
jgi:hypothetical protein